MYIAAVDGTILLKTCEARTGLPGRRTCRASTVGVPLYACGGGTIPLLQEWLRSGMSIGSAAAFMITGPATKITNLGAWKIALGWKRFALYILFVMVFSFLAGVAVNLLV